MIQSLSCSNMMNLPRHISKAPVMSTTEGLLSQYVFEIT
eukprot:COSAG01_NODE_56489_length_318_cov_0.689498_1_plen_38_part_10